MHDEPVEIRVLAIGDEPLKGLGPDVRLVLAEAHTSTDGCDAVLMLLRSAEELADGAIIDVLQSWVGKVAVLVVAPGVTTHEGTRLIGYGVQDVLDSRDPETLVRALRYAVARRRLQQAARLVYATDLSTGLPHQEQFLEYISQLIALRAREPAALVVIVLRTENCPRWSAQLGEEGAHVLRRKLAVRLRASLRASDVVASMGTDMFGVLLGHVDSVNDGHQVVAKLVSTLQQPVVVSGQSFEVTMTAGLAQWPEHGHDPQDLLLRAIAQATSAPVYPEAARAPRLSDRPFAMAANDEPTGS